MIPLPAPAIMPSRLDAYTPNVLPRTAAVCADLAVGLEAVTKHAPELALETSSLVAALSLPGARRASRLRWEWLASTGSTLDGAPNGRLLAECAALADRILADLRTQRAPDDAIKQAAIRVHLLAARQAPLGLSL